jgi:hypothetical protein
MAVEVARNGWGIVSHHEQQEILELRWLPSTAEMTDDEGRRYRALEREIAKTPGTFFFCCLLYADDTDFPAAIELGVLRPDRLHVERFRNRFDI